MHLKSLVLSPWCCFLASENTDVLLRTRTFTTLSPNFSFLNFTERLAFFSLSAPCGLVLSWVRATLTLPSHCPSPSQPQTPPTLVQIAVRAQTQSFLSSVKSLQFPSEWHSMPLTQSRPSFPALAPSCSHTKLPLEWELSPTLRLPHGLGPCSSPLHLHNSFPPGPDLGWANAPGLNSQATWEHFSDTRNWWEDAAGSSIYTLHRSQELELLISVAISSTVCHICYQYFSEICLNFIYMVLYKVTFLFIQSINMPFMVFSFILFSCFPSLSCLFLEKLTFDVSQVIERLGRRQDKHKKTLFPGGVH